MRSAIWRCEPLNPERWEETEEKAVQMSVAVQELKFPVITLSKGIIQFAENVDQLCTATPAGVRNRSFVGMQVVDSTGTLVTIANAEKIGGLGRFWGFRFLLPRRLKVRLSFEPEIRSMSLPELKATLKTQLRKDRYGWEACAPFEELDSTIDATRTIEELMKLSYWKPDARLL